MNERFAASVLKLRPDFALNDGYFHYVPVGKILSGFVYEQLRDHARIRSFALPLYENAEHVNDRETAWVMSLESRRRVCLGLREARSAAD